MANAHENIDNEIVANTLQEILNTGRGESMDVLYKALTKGGDERYIHRNIQGLPTKGRREWQGNILREQIAQDPTFADTLSYREGKERLAPQESITSKLLKALGIYQEGGEVENRIDLGNLISSAESSSTGSWQESNITPPTGKLPSERDAMQDLHTVLGLSGMIPGIGNVADIVDASIYGLEGKGGDAALSLTAALPVAGLLAGGTKAIKGGTKALSKADVAKEAERMGMAQDVVGKFGGDISDPKLVSNIHEEISGAVTSYTDMGKNITEPLLKAGYSTDDAIALTTYVQSKTPEGIKAAKDLADMGLSEIDMWGKEAVEAMNKSQQRAAEILMEDVLAGGKLHKMLGLDF